MAERTEALNAILAENYGEIRSLFEGLSDEDLGRRTELGWSVRQIAGHITQGPSGDIYVARRLSQGKSSTLPGFLAFIVNLTNGWVVRKFKNASKADLLASWENEHNQLAAFVSGLTGEQRDYSGEVMNLGRITTMAYLEQSPSHSREHAQQIRKALDSAE